MTTKADEIRQLGLEAGRENIREREDAPKVERPEDGFFSTLRWFAGQQYDPERMLSVDIGQARRIVAAIDSQPARAEGAKAPSYLDGLNAAHRICCEVSEQRRGAGEAASRILTLIDGAEEAKSGEPSSPALRLANPLEVELADQLSAAMQECGRAREHDERVAALQQENDRLSNELREERERAAKALELVGTIFFTIGSRTDVPWMVRVREQAEEALALLQPPAVSAAPDKHPSHVWQTELGPVVCLNCGCDYRGPKAAEACVPVAAADAAGSERCPNCSHDAHPGRGCNYGPVHDGIGGCDCGHDAAVVEIARAAWDSNEPLTPEDEKRVDVARERTLKDIAGADDPAVGDVWEVAPGLGMSTPWTTATVRAVLPPLGDSRRMVTEYRIAAHGLETIVGREKLVRKVSPPPVAPQPAAAPMTELQEATRIKQALDYCRAAQTKRKAEAERYVGKPWDDRAKQALDDANGELDAALLVHADTLLLAAERYLDTQRLAEEATGALDDARDALLRFTAEHEARR